MNGGAASFSGALGKGIAAVLTGDGAHQEEAEPGAFHAQDAAIGHAVEAAEDALEMGLRNAEALSRDADHDPGIAFDGKHDGEMCTVRRVFHRVVDDVQYCRAQLFGIAGNVEAGACLQLSSLYMDRVRVEMIAKHCGGGRLLYQFIHVHADAYLGACPLTEFARFQHLLHGCHQAVGVLAHHGEERLLLLGRDIAPAHGVEVETDGGDGRLQLVRHSVDEAVLLLVAAHFAHQKDGVEDESYDQQGEEGDAYDERRDTPPVEDQPAELQGNGDAHQADAERDEEEHRPTAPRDPHRHECDPEANKSIATPRSGRRYGMRVMCIRQRRQGADWRDRTVRSLPALPDRASST